MREVCFLIGEGETVLWSDASSSPVAMPDSRTRWNAIWSRRDALVEIAHSHPNGPSAFSETDETTMAALDSALGRRLRFSVVAPAETIVRLGGKHPSEPRLLDVEPWWTHLLRLASGMPAAPVAAPNEKGATSWQS